MTIDQLPQSADGWRLPDALLTRLHAAYTQPVRAYHHFGHVREVLRHYQAVTTGPGWKHPREVYVAVLYHDAIYQPGRSDNEIRSADLAVLELGTLDCAATLELDRVRQLIESTARHGKLTVDAVDADTALFLDCDMAILGSDAHSFDRYDEAIATEYHGVVPQFLYRFHRRRFLKKLLHMERIYLSDHGHACWELPARDNLRRVLQAQS